MDSEPRTFDRSSRSRLSPRDFERFPGETLFARFARAVCRAGCLPRKELFEAWEVARRVRRKLDGRRVVDLAYGHGLMAHALTLLVPGVEAAVGIDSRRVPSGDRVAAELRADWPSLAARVELREGDLRDLALTADDLVVSVHACGSLSDVVVDRAIAAGAQVAVLPCCHRITHHERHWLTGWIEDALAIDVDRAMRLRHAGYQVWTGHIPAEITPKNRLIMARPPEPDQRFARGGPYQTTSVT